jgi:hypothetical protein
VSNWDFNPVELYLNEIIPDICKDSALLPNHPLMPFTALITVFK